MFTRRTCSVFAFLLFAGLWLWALIPRDAEPSADEHDSALAAFDEHDEARETATTLELRFDLELDHDHARLGRLEISPRFAISRFTVQPSAPAWVPPPATHDPSQPRGPPARRV